MCYSFYTSGDFTKDADGFDNQCTWCGEGGNLLICDYCVSAFCKKCIRVSIPTYIEQIIGRINEYPTMHCFGISRTTQSMIHYVILTEYFWESHRRNVVNMPF